MALRILIVDDYAAVRRGVCVILSSRLDIEVCGEAGNGEEAVEKAKALRPDLIILDVTMPVLNGFDAAKEILKMLPGVPILMLSMHQHQQFVDEAKKAGVQGYVTKAQIGDTLLHAVDALLSGQKYFPQMA
jgi:two-component system, NarL family, response regulator NreC